MAQIKKVIKNWTTYDVFNSDNVDSTLNTSSTNAIQNGAVATALDTKITNPSWWTVWQVLKKTANWEEWANESWLVTSVNGQTGAVTVNEFDPASAGTTDQILTKTANGYDWANAPVSWIQIDPNSPIQLQYIWAWTQAQYDALSSYSDTTAYLTI